MQHIHVVSGRNASNDEWDHFWARSNDATFYQSRYWAATWEEYSRGRLRAFPSVLRFSDGRELLVPFLQQRIARGAVTRNVFSAVGTYGGWLSPEEISLEHVHALAEYVRRHSNVIWRVNPFQRHGDAMTMLGNVISDATHVVDLSAGFEPVLDRWTKGHYSAATKAKREGVEVIQAKTQSDWAAYYSIYEDTLTRWGGAARSRYEREFFLLLSRVPTEYVTLWLARYQGQYIAGALCLYSNSHASYWHGAALDSHFKLRPVHWLIYNAIENACGRGVRWFDFNPSAGLNGVISFKQGFGCTVVPAPSVDIKGVALRLFEKSRPLWGKRSRS